MADDGGSSWHDKLMRLHREAQAGAGLESFRATINIGLFCLKAVLILNGAASISLISMHAIIASHEEIGRALICSGYFFWSGLVAAGITAGLFYFFQASVTDGIWNPPQENEKIQSSLSLRTLIFDIPISLWIIIVFCLASFVLFALGGFSVLIALGQLVGSAAS